MILPRKLDVANRLFGAGSSMFVHLDSRHNGVIVPPWLSQKTPLVLQFGLALAIPIHDLAVDERGVFGTLSFTRGPFACLIPWDAVFALVGDDNKGMIWPESISPEVAEAIRTDKPGKPTSAPHLRVIDGGRK